MVWTKIPATSANMGPGFDSLGVALSLYNTITMQPIKGKIVIENKVKGEYTPIGENNLIYRAAKRVFDEVSYKIDGLKITQQSEIPMTRGLGSSSACVIGGMLCANVISGRKLSYREILNLAADMEGHPDNVTPALFGGLCAAVKTEKETFYRSVKLEKPMSFVAMVPDYFVSTRKSRVSLPDKIQRSDAVFNAGRAALFALSITNGDFKNLKESVKDKLHQPYRSAYIDNMDEIFKKAYESSAHAVWLSGSGPTIMALLDKDNKSFLKSMNQYFQGNNMNWRLIPLSIDNVGAIVKEIV